MSPLVSIVQAYGILTDIGNSGNFGRYCTGCGATTSSVPTTKYCTCEAYANNDGPVYGEIEVDLSKYSHQKVQTMDEAKPPQSLKRADMFAPIRRWHSHSGLQRLPDLLRPHRLWARQILSGLTK